METKDWREFLKLYEKNYGDKNKTIEKFGIDHKQFNLWYYTIKEFGENCNRIESMRNKTIEDEIYKFSDVVPGEKQSSNQWFSVCMLTGKNREVRKLFESQDLEVSRLKRVRIGPIFLPSTLREGACANLTDSQIKELQEYGK